MPNSAPISSWDTTAFVVSETAFATTPTPASVGAYAAQAIEIINLGMGNAADVGGVRAQQDRGVGRGMQKGFVEGRVIPEAFTLKTSVKTRASAVTASPLDPLLSAAGLKKTVGATVVYAPSATPIESEDLKTVSITGTKGTGLATSVVETLAGCVVSKLSISCVDSECLAEFSGVGAKKTTQGHADGITVDSSVGSESHAVEFIGAVQPGYYSIESEVIKVTSIDAGTPQIFYFTRGVLGSTAVAHTAKSIIPFKPTGITFTGAPISEAVSTVTLGGVDLRCTAFKIEIMTGVDLLNGESGSRYSQGPKYARYNVDISAKIQIRADQMHLVGKARSRNVLPVVISQGTSGGAGFRFTAALAEIISFPIPDTANDIAIVDIKFRLRDSEATGNDMFSMELF